MSGWTSGPPIIPNLGAPFMRDLKPAISKDWCVSTGSFCGPAGREREEKQCGEGRVLHGSPFGLRRRVSLCGVDVKSTCGESEDRRTLRSHDPMPLFSHCASLFRMCCVTRAPTTRAQPYAPNDAPKHLDQLAPTAICTTPRIRLLGPESHEARSQPNTSSARAAPGQARSCSREISRRSTDQSLPGEFVPSSP